MKKTALFLSLLVSLLTLSPSALARDPVPIINYNDIPVVTGSGKPVTAEQVRDAILVAAKSNNWEMGKAPSQDLLSATLNVRGKHTVVVSIPYSAGMYSVQYQSSNNMKYRIADSTLSGSVEPYKSGPPAQSIPAGTPMIHPYYDRWVQNLLQAIKIELKKI
jgi:hypothetical protein